MPLTNSMPNCLLAFPAPPVAVSPLLCRPMPINLSHYDAVYLDLDGTIFDEDHPLPGGIELIQALQQKAIPFACLTNSTSSPARLHKRLHVMGVEIPTERIHTAGAAAVDYVLERFGPMPRVFNLATESV